MRLWTLVLNPTASQKSPTMPEISPGGLFNLVGLCKIKVVKKPATKARKGINPFTGEETVFKAKPARKAVKILPLKGLKDMV